MTRRTLLPVEVEWDDACHTQEWVSRRSVRGDGLYRNATTGYVVRKTRRSIIVAQSRSISDQDHIGDYIAIPTHSVRKIRRLKHA